MRGSNNQMNRPRMPGPNMMGGPMRQPNPNLAAVLLQQQQQILLQRQQQQFMARQQVIQMEQLQKQRIMRQQQEEKALREKMLHHQQYQLKQQQQQQMLLQQQQQLHHSMTASQRSTVPCQQNIMRQDARGSGASCRSVDMRRPSQPMVPNVKSKSIFTGHDIGYDRGRHAQSSSQQSQQFKSPSHTRQNLDQGNNSRFVNTHTTADRNDHSGSLASGQRQRSGDGPLLRPLSKDSRDRNRSEKRGDDRSRQVERDSNKATGRSTVEKEQERYGSSGFQKFTGGRKSSSHGWDNSDSQDKRVEEKQTARSMSRSFKGANSPAPQSSSESRPSSRCNSGRGSVDRVTMRSRHDDRDGGKMCHSRESSASWGTDSGRSSLALSSSDPPESNERNPDLTSSRKRRYQEDVNRKRSLSRSTRSPARDRNSSRSSEVRTESRKTQKSASRDVKQLKHDSPSSISEKGRETSLKAKTIHTASEFASSIDSPYDISGINPDIKEEAMEEVSIKEYITRSCPADLYFTRNSVSSNLEATNRMIELESKFEGEMNKRLQLKSGSGLDGLESQQQNSQRRHHHHHHHHHHHSCSGAKKSSSSSGSSSSSDDDDDGDDGGVNEIMEEWERRKKHPQSLHSELWFNLKDQANDGPLCRCSIKSRQSGIRHDIYPGEKAVPLCNLQTNNLDRLYHYRMTMSPYTNFLTKVPTLIYHDNHEYIFEGFSMFSHVPLDNIPPCKLLRFNIEYTINFVSEPPPENFTVRSLNLFNTFIFTEILELVNLDWKGPKLAEDGSEGCNFFHFMPRFCRTLPDSCSKEILSMNTVLSFLLRSMNPLVEESRVEEIMGCDESEWHDRVDNLRGMIVMKPGMRPAAIRIDQLDRKVTTPIMKVESFSDADDADDADKHVKKEKIKSLRVKEEQGSGCAATKPTEKGPVFPLIIHQGNRPAQLSYAGDPQYKKSWKHYVKFRHLLNSKPKVCSADKSKLKVQEERLRDIRMKKTMKREVTVELSSQGFLTTGLRADLCQHALMVPVLMSHLRFQICLGKLEETLQYKFKDRNLLQLCLTHTSYRTNYGSNPDHTRNSLTNCGMRQLDYGDRRIHYQYTRKRGICILVDIMSRMGKQEETTSDIPHNERLEFLGDAVIEFLTSIHLFYMFPWLDEGGLTTYRMALVQNQHLALLAKKLKLQDFMLYVHGPDLCHESDLRHAMANCCEAIMGALFLDGGIEVADAVFSKALFDDEEILLKTWTEIPKHVLQHEEPGGDRHWIKSSPILKKLEKFEESVGIKFTHIRLLAKAFTHRNIGINPLTRGHNQRLEFLGDTVLQLVASEYLYWHFPEHHEGHLSLLRSSLVNSRTQSMVYYDLGMSEYVIFSDNHASHEGPEMKTKQRADILESFVGALFVDKDLDYCRTFCNVCFFPRLKDFILNQDWNDPKSQLQQCCLTLREVGGGEPDIPIYKVIESIGPTNTRKYVVAVYFRGKRLASGSGHNIQQAEMSAATEALKRGDELFPILQHQRRFLERIQKSEQNGRDGSPDKPTPGKEGPGPKKARWSVQPERGFNLKSRGRRKSALKGKRF